MLDIPILKSFFSAIATPASQDLNFNRLIGLLSVSVRSSARFGGMSYGVAWCDDVGALGVYLKAFNLFLEYDSGASSVFVRYGSWDGSWGRKFSLGSDA
jgi:hypothetical protein